MAAGLVGKSGQQRRSETVLESVDDLFSRTRPSFEIPLCKKSCFSTNFRKSVFALGKCDRLGMRVFRGGALKERGTGSRVTPNS